VAKGFQGMIERASAITMEDIKNAEKLNNYKEGDKESVKFKYRINEIQTKPEACL